MNIKEIVSEHLKANNYDGLINVDIACACELIDLMPCGEPHELNCKAGYKFYDKEGFVMSIKQYLKPVDLTGEKSNDNKN